MNRKKIGIIGGAGPNAGSLLFDKVIEVFQRKYGCKRDSEFPYMLLFNFPFSDMLSKNTAESLIRKELSECFQLLEKNDIDITAISCNTLHAFLPILPPKVKLVHMVEETKKIIEKNGHISPLVLCTTTSSKKKLHQEYFPCEYLDQKLQLILDKMIADITLGAGLKPISDALSNLLPEHPILLGCTEFSYLHERVPLRAKTVFDPNAIVAEKMADLYFSISPASSMTPI